MASKDIMLFFGHTGITAGIFYLASKIRRAGRIDYRLVLIGALLPDIIDKPLGLVILNYGNGRIIAHTLLFALLLTAVALYKKDMRLYALSGGTWLHLLFDSMWLFPVTLLWPLLGGFPYGNLSLYSIFNSVDQPLVYLPEIAGATILIYIIVKNKLYKKTNVMRFIRTGEIG